MGNVLLFLIRSGIIDLGAFCVELWSFFVSKRISVPMSYISFWEHCLFLRDCHIHWRKHCLLLRDGHILNQNIAYCCEIDIFLTKALLIVVRLTYSSPKHCLLLRNRSMLVQNIAYCYEIDIFLTKTLLIVARLPYASPQHCLLFRDWHILSHNIAHC